MALKQKKLNTVFSLDTLPEISHISLQSTSKKKPKPKLLSPLSIGSSSNNVLTTISNANTNINHINSEGSLLNKYHLDTLKKSFKNNFYEDVTPNTLMKLQKNVSFNDRNIANQVVYLNKFVHFWKCFCDYSNPIVSIAKLKSTKKANENKRKANEHKQQVYAYKDRVNHVNRHRVYTNSTLFEVRHENRIKRERDFYNRAKLIERNMYMK